MINQHPLMLNDLDEPAPLPMKDEDFKYGVISPFHVNATEIPNGAGMLWIFMMDGVEINGMTPTYWCDGTIKAPACDPSVGVWEPIAAPHHIPTNATWEEVLEEICANNDDDLMSGYWDDEDYLY